MSQDPALVELRHVSVMRGQRLALDDVSLRIGADEHVAVLGPNGSGKSTLVKVISRELYPLAREGSSVAVFGREDWEVSELRCGLGLVSSDLAALYARRVTALDAVVSGFFSSVGLWPHHEVTPSMREEAGRILELLEVPHLAGRLVSELSSGEARRILVGRALVHRPRALLFDEPSNSLDIQAQLELRWVMSRLARSGLSIVLVTHHLPDIIPEIERVIFLGGGRVVADGPKRELLTSARMSELFDVPLEVEEREGEYRLW